MLVAEAKRNDHMAQASNNGAAAAAPRRFARGEKASVSVRLGRSSRYDINASKKASSRLSGDFGEWTPVAALAENKTAMPPDDDLDGGFSRRKSINISPLKDVLASSSSAVAGSPSKRFPFYRGGGGGAAHEATKTCNSEFSFARRIDAAAVASEARPESRPQSMAAVALRRVPGLGRRAATQLQMEVRPQSMMIETNLCRSQENLVQLSRGSSMAPSSSSSSSSSAHPVPPPSGPALRKGSLWTQRDCLFSKWKERYFVLSADALCCFRSSAADECVFRLRLCDVDGVELLDRRGYLTVCLATARDGRLFLRKADGITDWYNTIKKCVSDNSTGESTSRSPGTAGAAFRSARQATDSVSIEQWVRERKKKALSSTGLSGSSPDIHKLSEVAAASSSSSGGERRITLEELSALYSQQEEDETGEEQAASRPSRNHHMASASMAHSAAAPVHVRMRNVATRHAPANRLSLMTDLELLALDKRSRGSGAVLSPLSRLPDTASNEFHRDSGHHSLSTNASVSSSGSSRSRDSREDCDPARSNGFSHGGRAGVSSRRSSQPLGVQVTHV